MHANANPTLKYDIHKARHSDFLSNSSCADWLACPPLKNMCEMGVSQAHKHDHRLNNVWSYYKFVDLVPKS